MSEFLCTSGTFYVCCVMWMNKVGKNVMMDVFVICAQN